jgi:thiamine-phosphate pyrophosphorylase
VPTSGLNCPPMPARCLLYYITDRRAFPGDESMRRRRLLEKIAGTARAGVDYIQLREKDLSVRDLESLAREAVRLIRELRAENRELRTALLINSRIDVALAAGADGVHLRSDDILPQEVGGIWRKSHVGTAALGDPSLGSAAVPNISGEPATRSPLIGTSCHSPAEVVEAAANGASFAVFAPVFEKKDASETQPAGLAQLEQACRATIPVLALGGVTLANAHSCLEAGAAGIAGIRLFQENAIAAAVRQLRSNF